MKGRSSTVSRDRYEPGRISFQTAGSGPAVVLIHGLGGSSRWWKHSIGPLSERFRVYAVDLIGFGDSRPGRFVLDDAAHRLRRWMESLGVGRAHVVGHSMGGYIAAELAADFPHIVEKLVLVNAAALPLDPGPRLVARRLRKDWRYLPLRLLPILIQDAWRAKPWTIWNAARQLLSSDLRPKLGRIQAATLVIAGAHDTVVPLEMSRALSGMIPGASFVTMPESGHNCLWDHPNEFNERLTAFLAA